MLKEETCFLFPEASTFVEEADISDDNMVLDEVIGTESLADATAAKDEERTCFGAGEVDVRAREGMNSVEKLLRL